MMPFPYIHQFSIKSFNNFVRRDLLGFPDDRIFLATSRITIHDLTFLYSIRHDWKMLDRQQQQRRLYLSRLSLYVTIDLVSSSSFCSFPSAFTVYRSGAVYMSQYNDTLCDSWHDIHVKRKRAGCNNCTDAEREAHRLHIISPLRPCHFHITNPRQLLPPGPAHLFPHYQTDNVEIPTS
jgi:hypothetical protein